MQREREQKTRQWQGIGFFVVVQAMLMATILWLLYLVRRNSEAWHATVVLLAIPVGLLLPDLIRWLTSDWTARSTPYYASNLYLIAFALLAPTVVVFIYLVVKGPAEQWGAVGIGIRRAQSLFLFFTGLWALIAVFALAYKLDQGEAWNAAFRYSSSIALGLPTTVVPQSGSLATITLIGRIAFIMWLGFCAAAIRPPQSTLWSGTWASNVPIALASLLLVAIAVASAFTLLYFAAVERGGFVEGLSRRQCFWLSLATLFRQGYVGIPMDAAGVWWLQAIEVHVGLFLGLVGFRVIYAIPWKQDRGASANVVRPVEMHAR